MKISNNVMNLAILSAIIFLIIFFNSRYVPSSIVNSALTSILIALVSLYIQNSNLIEKFTFEVSKNKQKCNVKGLIGRPISVDFETSNCTEEKTDEKQYNGYLGKPGTFIGV